MGKTEREVGNAFIFIVVKQRGKIFYTPVITTLEVERKEQQPESDTGERLLVDGGTTPPFAHSRNLSAPAIFVVVFCAWPDGRDRRRHVELVVEILPIVFGK